MYKHLQYRDMSSPPVNVSTLREMKNSYQPIVCITAYDASFAQLVDMCGVDLVLVGDSVGMVVQGYDTTVPVTVDDICYHTKLVSRGLSRSYLVSDLPFMSYSSADQALENSVRLMQEGGAMMVKLEGGSGQYGIVEHLSNHDIPVCAHIGLKPQSVHKIGGFKVQGRDQSQANRMIDDAKALESAGADIILLECIPSELGKVITESVNVPVIGIGAGPHVDGQILVIYDLLGITQGPTPRFVKDYMAEKETHNIMEALALYVEEVRSGKYPAKEHCFS
jgi:3-methyl-2-oxobutanoate hydroxymethyltransferase